MPALPSLSFLTGGDIAPETIAPASMLGRLSPVFQAADVSFLNVEHPLSDAGTPVRGKRFLHRGRSDHVAGLVDAGVSAINLANNHILDFGDDGLLDTIASFQRHGIPTFGAGADRTKAAAAVVLEKNGLSVGLLGFTSTLPTGFAAGEGTAGVNPIRVRTAYRPAFNLDELPGTAPIIETWPAAEDLARLVADVAALKARVDVVLVYVHWGTSMVPQVHEHQSTIGRAAIEAGADAVFGGHQHVVSAVEFHLGKPIVHCTGDLVFDVVEPWFDAATERNFLFGARLTRDGLEDCYALPCTTGIGRPPELQSPGSEIGRQVLEDLRVFSAPFGTQVRADGDRIFLAPGSGAMRAPRFRAALHTMDYPSARLSESPGAASDAVPSSGEKLAAEGLSKGA